MHRKAISCHVDQQHVVRAKLNLQLSTYYCIVLRGMQSALIILPSQTCWTYSTKSRRVALDFIAKYDHQALRLSFLHLYHFYMLRLLSFQAVGFYVLRSQF